MENMGNVFLDPDQREKLTRASGFCEERLSSRIVGQERAVSGL
jgi:hypothetical protein